MSHIILTNDCTKIIPLYIIQNETKLGNQQCYKNKIYGRKTSMLPIKRLKGNNNIIFDPLIKQLEEAVLQNDLNPVNAIGMILLLDYGKVGAIAGSKLFKDGVTIMSLKEYIDAPGSKNANIMLNTDALDLELLGLTPELIAKCIVDNDVMKHDIGLNNVVESNDVLNIVEELSVEDYEDEKKSSLNDEYSISNQDDGHIDQITHKIKQFSDIISHLDSHNMSILSIEQLVERYDEILRHAEVCKFCQLLSNELYMISCGMECSSTWSWPVTSDILRDVVCKNVAKQYKDTFFGGENEATLKDLEVCDDYSYKQLFYLLFKKLDKQYFYLMSEDNSVPKWDALCSVKDITRVARTSINKIEYFKTMFRGENIPSGIIIDFVFTSGGV